MRSVYDSKAVKILFSTFWSSSGWKEKQEPGTSSDDFDYALAHGVMFRPVEWCHDDIIKRLRELAARLRPESVGEAFLYSLSSHDLAYRSALGSYAAAAWMPAHTYSEPGVCKICGDYEWRGESTDLNVLNFERLKWGGVRHAHAVYQLFDLAQFEKLPSVRATGTDYDMLQSILSAAGAQAGDVWCRELERAIAGLFPSSKPQREKLLEILSYCGVVAPKDRPGFFREWPTMAMREQRPANKIDWTYPIMWWQGRDGVNFKAVDHYFPMLREGSKEL